MLLHCESDGTPAQVAQRDGGVSLLGDFLKTSGHCPRHLALYGHAGKGGLDQMTSSAVFQPQLFDDYLLLSTM